MTRRPPAALTVVTLFALASVARATDIVAGPIVGQVTDSSARVWVQINTSERVGVRAVDVISGQSPGGVSIDVEGPAPFVADLPISQLEPNRNYRIEITFDGKPVDVGPPLIVRTAPPPGEPASFTVAAAAGVDVGPGGRRAVPAAAAVADLKPQQVLFLGNLGLLPPTEDAFPRTRKEAFAQIAHSHQAARTNRDLRAVFRATPVLAVWGERDFGPENSGRSFIYARESMLAFRRYWPNPMYGTPEAKGVFFTHAVGDVQFFVLDARMQRTSPGVPADPQPGAQPASQPAETGPAATTSAPAPKGPQLFGPGQLKWLEAELAKSKATLKVIAASSPLLADDPALDGWAKYPKEREAFIEYVLKQQVPGVVFLSSGPYGQIVCRKPADAGAYPLYELVCPPLGVKPGEPGQDAARLGAFAGNGFGTLLFGGGSKAKRFVTLQVRDEKGVVKVDQTVFAGNLQGQ